MRVSRGEEHDSDFGGFVDAMADKLFGCFAVVALVRAKAVTGTVWKSLVLIRMALHLCLAVKRIRDYFGFSAHRVSCFPSFSI